MQYGLQKQEEFQGAADRPHAGQQPRRNRTNTQLRYASILYPIFESTVCTYNTSAGTSDELIPTVLIATTEELNNAPAKAIIKALTNLSLIHI